MKFKVGDRVRAIRFKERGPGTIASMYPDHINVQHDVWGGSGYGKLMGWYQEQDLQLIDVFHPGQTVSGDDIKRALQDGWVIKVRHQDGVTGRLTWHKDGNHLVSSGGNRYLFDDHNIKNLVSDYTLFRKQGEPKPDANGNVAIDCTAGVMEKPKRTPERPFLPGDVIKREGGGAEYTFKRMESCPHKGSHDCDRCPGRIFVDEDSFQCGQLSGKIFRLVTPVERKADASFWADQPSHLSGDVLIHQGNHAIDCCVADFPLTKGAKMGEELKKPETALEKKACAGARKEAVEKAVQRKKEEYAEAMREFIRRESDARQHQKLANELRKKLGVTDKEMKEIFG